MKLTFSHSEVIQYPLKELQDIVHHRNLQEKIKRQISVADQLCHLYILYFILESVVERSFTYHSRHLFALLGAKADFISKSVFMRCKMMTLGQRTARALIEMKLSFPHS